MMKNKEAIETIKMAIAEVEWEYPMDYSVAFEKAVEALEKQIPKKPRKGVVFMACPNCSHEMPVQRECCEHCGQKLDWSDEE